MSHSSRSSFSPHPMHSEDSTGGPSSVSHLQYSPSIGRYNVDYLRGTSSSFGMGQSATSSALLRQPFHSNAQNMARLPAFEMNLVATPSTPNAHLAIGDDAESLKRMVRELQMRNEELRAQLEELHGELSAPRFQRAYAADISSAVSFSHPSAGIIQGTQVMSQMGKWRRRREARIRKFCAPNRAGNALCSWHETRRERRAYPPRMAPEGTLNCGCTIEEALFEESLARHGVGSYLPGDSVRMDPALRNPLLRLLRTRYGYRDGDFEWDHVREDWIEGEGPEVWEAELKRSSGKGQR